MGNPDILKVVKIKCEVCKGNPDGFYECNADAVPDGAVLFGSEEPKRRGRKPKVD